MSDSPLLDIAKRVLHIPSANITGLITGPVKGILINRDPPITTGYCGNDNCEHTSHKQRRAAQKGADTRAKK